MVFAFSQSVRLIWKCHAAGLGFDAGGMLAMMKILPCFYTVAVLFVFHVPTVNKENWLQFLFMELSLL